MRRLRVLMNLLFHGERAGGVGRYARELVAALADDPGELELDVVVSRNAPLELTTMPWVSEVRMTSVPVPVHGPAHLAGQLVALPMIAAARRADVLHNVANFGPVSLPGVASVTTMHDLIWMRMGTGWESARAVKAMRRWAVPAARRADRLITVSAHAAAEIEGGLGIPRNRIDIVPPGIRIPERARPRTSPRDLRARLDLGDGPVVLCVAQKRPYKNQELLVRAVVAMADARVRLVLVGASTPYEATLRTLVDDVGAADRVRFVDWLEEADLEGLYELASCVALPSRYEGFGVPPLEAMARGVPVAVANATALPEVVGDAALLFPPDDVEGARRAIEHLLFDADLRARLIDLGRARVASFTWERSAQMTIDSYRRAVSSRRR